ncbi:MAG: tripartite tricarboxylate transporter substrate binding protein [Betaproteobacteria bacterium]|nr:tripartite tricarboxylate transporter substrate binding protein [Betaproteobacteria bacterium]
MLSPRASLTAALVCLSVLLPVLAQAQAYPSRPITLVVPYTPGTGIDIIARTLGPRITQRWGQPVVVDNKPGASGNIGADVVAKAKPDGYTLMVTVNTFVITPALFKNLPYDPVADFATVGKVATGNVALVVNPTALPVRTLEELKTAARSQPGKFSYSSPGNGTPQHLAVELLKQRLGVDFLHVPYKGAAGALTDLLGGQVQLAILPVHTALPHFKAGKLAVIAVSGERRSVLAPDLPSFAELGLDNLAIDLYFWIAGPAGTPREVILRWNQEVASILQLPEVRDSLLKQGLVPSPGTPEEIAEQIRSDVDRWKKFIAETGIKAD